MVFVGPAKEGFEVTAKAIHEQTKENPYWLVYDIVKLEQRDAQVTIRLLRPFWKLWLSEKNTFRWLIRNSTKFMKIVGRLRTYRWAGAL